MEEGERDILAVSQDVVPELPRRDWDLLSKPYSKAEIDMVNNHMKSLKAPGPNGFQDLFYQKTEI